MTTESTLKQRSIDRYAHIEALPDPPEEERDMEQFDGIYAFASALRPYFAHRSDVLISSEAYLCENAGDIGEFYFDGVFAEGLDDPQAIIKRNGYVISEVGKPPDLVLEVGSRNTGRRDYTVKRDGYAGYGVREYWRFDPSGGEYHDAPLAADRLVDGEYERIEIVSETDGRHWGYSDILGLELWWDSGTLRFRDRASGDFLLTPEESQEALVAAEARADTERAARDIAEERANSERAARLEAETRLAQMQAELRRLRDGK